MVRFFYFPNVVQLFTLTVLFNGFAAGTFAQTTHKVSGFVREADSELPLADVNVATSRLGLGTRSGSDGSFSLTVATTDSLRLSFSHVGYATVTTVVSDPSQSLTIHLRPGAQLKEVVVRSAGSAGRLSNQTSLSRIAISMDQLKKIPALLGEKDVLKVIQLLPGVQKGSEGNAGVYVRGGGPDQNLILLDEAVVYNPSHLFGFFSVFNGDVLKSVSLTKGGFPAQYGGRLSSVIDLTTKDGNRERLRGEGSVGLIASRLTLDGPLGRRASFLVSGRYSYYGLITRHLAKHSTQGSPDETSFYDLNAKFNLDLGRDQLSLSAYTGHDQFAATRLANDASLQSGLAWGNTTASLRWKRVFSENLFANTALLYSGYGLTVSNQEAVSVADGARQVYQLDYASSIRDVSFKTDWDLYAGPHHLRLGLQSTLHRFTPSAVVVASADATLNSVQELTSLESGIYVEDEWKLGDRLRLNPGLRLSHYRQARANFLRPEPRLSLAYELPRAWALKASYAKMNQYVHLLSNTGTGLPTDLWVPSTERVRPQQSQQVAAGIAKDFLKKGGESTGLSLTLEGYIKTMSNLLSYREGASFLLPTGIEAGASRWEDDVTAGQGQSYGVEVLLQKKRGRFSGWAGYTLSRTSWQFDDLNNGQPFHPRHDRRHDVSLVGIYEFSSRIRLSGTWVYGSGQALTVPVARYAVNVNSAVSTTNPKIVRDYSGKNGFRGEAYHRLDLSLQFIRQRAGRERIWELSVYNAYNRRNPFFYALEGKTDAATKTSHSVFYRYSLFSAIPTLSYSFKL